MPCPLPPPLWGGACGRFGWPRPACVGQCVLQRYVWYGCCRLLAVMSSLRARYHTKLLFSPCKRCPCPCSDAVHSPSSPPSGLRGFVPVVRDHWEQGTGEGGGGYHWGGGGGGSPGPESMYRGLLLACLLTDLSKQAPTLTKPMARQGQHRLRQVSGVPPKQSR